jgi:GNAT superfamily N-acetyltransferase
MWKRCTAFLTGDAHWAKGLDRAVVDRALEGSLPVGVDDADGTMAAFVRVVTDWAMFAYLRFVFTAPAHRGRGLASWPSLVIRDPRELRTVTNWMIATRDAHAV